MAHVPIYTYANTTITSTGVSSGSGLTYTTGTGVTDGTWSTGTGSYMGAGKMKLIGDDADLEINGKSLNDTLKTLEQRLNMLVPNPEMEKEWDELKRLGDAYRKLEAECVEKSKMWKALKKT